MSDLTTDTAPSHNTEHHWYSGIGNYFAFAMAGVATMATAWRKINTSFHKTYFEDVEFFEVGRKSKNTAYKELLDECEGDYKAFSKRKHEIDKTFHNEEKKFTEQMGVHNFIDKFGKIKNHQKLDVILTVVTVISIAAGAIYNISRNNKLTAAVQYHEQTKDDKVKQEAMENARAELAKQYPARADLAAQVQQQAEGQKQMAYG